MSTQQIPGAPYAQNSRVVVRTNQDHTLDPNTDILVVDGPDITVKLPQNAPFGRCFRILATAGEVELDGNGFPIRGGMGGMCVEDGTALEITLSPTKEWVPTASGASNVFLQNRFGTTIDLQINNSPNPPTVIRQISITPQNPIGSKLRYKAFVAFEVSAISAVTFSIKDPTQGIDVSAVRSYPTVPLFLVDSMTIEWEVEASVAGPHIVTLDMKTTAGFVQSSEVYLSVDEMN